MTYYQLEKFRELLEVIERIQTKINHAGGLKSTQPDKVHSSGGAPVDTIGNAVIEREELRKKLVQLEKLRDIKKPEVERTIKAAMQAAPIRRRMLVGLAFQSRYISGRDWFEVSEITGVKDPRQLVISSLERLEDET